MESSVLRIETSDLDRANQIGVNIAAYVELRQLGIPHSLSIRMLDFDSEEVDISQFLNESAGLTDKQKADVATGCSVYQLPLRDHSWSFELEYSDLMTMCFRLIKVGVESEEASQFSSKVLKAFTDSKGFGFLALDDVVDAVVSVARLKINLHLVLKDAVGLVTHWLDHWEDSDGVPQFSDRARLVIDLIMVFSIPTNLAAGALGIEFNDFDFLTDHFVGYRPDGTGKAKGAEEELLALTPVDLLARYPELLASYLESCLKAILPMVRISDGIFPLCEAMLKLEGFLFEDEP